MSEIWIIFLAVFIFVSFSDYLYVSVGDVFADQNGVTYQVVEKNPLFVRIANEEEQKTVSIMILCMRYMKVEM